MIEESEDEESDEETVARERAALQAATSGFQAALESPAPVPTTALLPCASGTWGVHANQGDLSGHAAAVEEEDSDVDEETIARERAALQAATSDTGQPQPLLLPAPRAAASSAGAPNNVHALERALGLNVQYQRMCKDELAAIDRALELKRQAEACAKAAMEPEPTTADILLGSASSTPATGVHLVAARLKPKPPKNASTVGFRHEALPFFFEAPAPSIEERQPWVSEDAQRALGLQNKSPMAPSVPPWGKEERHKLRAGVAAQLASVYHKSLLERFNDEQLTHEAARECKDKLIELEQPGFTETDAFLKARLDAQEEEGQPLGGGGCAALSWDEISRVHLPQRPPKACQIQWTNMDDPRLRLFMGRKKQKLGRAEGGGEEQEEPEELEEPEEPEEPGGEEAGPSGGRAKAVPMAEAPFGEDEMAVLLDLASDYQEHEWDMIASGLSQHGWKHRTPMACFRAYHFYRSSQPRPNRGVTTWTKEEDKTLAEAVRAEGDSNWIKVAQWVEGRSAQDCLVRWRYSVDPSIKRGKWTPEEDELLRQGVARYGAKDWAKWVPSHMNNGRTGPQCRGRWCDHLDPDKKKANATPWTEEEDAMLREAVGIHGDSNWSAVQRSYTELEHRTDAQCKQRWERHLDPLARRPTNSRTPVPWTADDDKALADAVAQHMNELEEVDWKGVHEMIKQTLPHHDKPTVAPLKTRWRKIKADQPQYEAAVGLLHSSGGGAASSAAGRAAALKGKTSLAAREERENMRRSAREQRKAASAPPGGAPTAPQAAASGVAAARVGRPVARGSSSTAGWRPPASLVGEPEEEEEEEEACLGVVGVAKRCRRAMHVVGAKAGDCRLGIHQRGEGVMGTKCWRRISVPRVDACCPLGERGGGTSRSVLLSRWRTIGRVQVAVATGS